MLCLIKSWGERFFKYSSSADDKLKQALLREGIIAKILLNKHALYLRVRLLLRFLYVKTILKEDCMNRILGFIFPDYNSDKINILYCANYSSSSDNFLISNGWEFLLSCDFPQLTCCLHYNYLWHQMYFRLVV